MQDFAAKRNALFACLDDASKELKGTGLDQSTTPKYSLAVQPVTGRIGKDRNLCRMRGKESIFKKPELPISRCLKPRCTPDYQRNPHKWKKYSLLDVDISDQTNTAAAFDFLKQIDEQREAASQMDNDDKMDDKDKSSKIEFRKCSKIKRRLKGFEANEVADEEVDRPKLKGSKLLMPEYVVGQRKAQKRNRTALKTPDNTRVAGSLTLSHLQNEDDGDVDDDNDAASSE